MTMLVWKRQPVLVSTKVNAKSHGFALIIGQVTVLKVINHIHMLKIIIIHLSFVK